MRRELLPLAECVAETGLKPHQLERACDDGRLTLVTLGGQRGKKFVTKRSLDRFLARGGASEYGKLRRRSGYLHPARTSIVYVIGDEEYVKIGTTIDLNNRLTQLQGGNPKPLALYAVLDGGPREERQLHRRFAGYHVLNEWFRKDGELAEWIDQNAV